MSVVGSACCNSSIPLEPVILLACGSFNPITTMHLRMMELARDKVERMWSKPPAHFDNDCRKFAVPVYHEDNLLEQAPSDCNCLRGFPPRRQVVVGGIFSPVSDGYGKPGLLRSSMRVELLRLACQFSSDWLAVDSWEAVQPNWTRTRLVADFIQARLDQISAKLNGFEHNLSQLEKSPFFNQSPNIETASDIQIGLATDAWLSSCLRQVVQRVPGCQCSTTGSTCGYKQDINSSRLPELESSSTGQAEKVHYPQAHVKMVFGADVLQSFAVPDLWSQEDLEKLIGDYGIICISRPGSDTARLIQSSELLRKYEDNIVLVTEWCTNNLSATMIRSNLRLGASVRYLVPDAVLEKIYAEGLYGAKKPRQFTANGLLV